MTSQFSGNIACTVRPGHVFLISGKSTEDAERFEVNLKNGKYEDAAIPLHISVRFDEDVIVRNTKTMHGWGPEDRTLNPLEAGQTFKIYILVGDYCFHVAVNDVHLGYYSYRAPLNIIRTIDIKDVQQINRVDHRSVFPSLWPRIQIDSPSIAFSNDIPMKINPGHVMIITGIPSGNPQGIFTIYFTEDGTTKQALHFNARFEPIFAVIRNSMNNYSKFEEEERDGDYFPFELDQPFKLAIAFTPNEFKFAINGQHFCEFQYRSENQLDRLNGFKVNVGKMMNLEITSVDHVFTGNDDCDGFEEYSNFDSVLH